MAEAARALAALHASLANDGARDAYWAAFSRFMRFEITKAEFDKLALAALGPHVKLHNNAIFAMVRDAQHASPGGAAPVQSGDLSGQRIFGVVDPLGASNGAASSAASSSQAMGGGGASIAPAPQASMGGPKLMLKIRSDGRGGMDASAARPELVVDPVEEAALNAMHERLIELSRQHGLQGVQPEAVSLMARAVRAVSNRLLVAANSVSTEGAPAESSSNRSVTNDHVLEGIRQSAPAPWMAPPCQRPSHTLGGFNKFIA